MGPYFISSCLQSPRPLSLALDAIALKLENNCLLGRFPILFCITPSSSSPYEPHATRAARPDPSGHDPLSNGTSSARSRTPVWGVPRAVCHQRTRGRSIRRREPDYCKFRRETVGERYGGSDSFAAAGPAGPGTPLRGRVAGPAASEDQGSGRRSDGQLCRHPFR